MAATETASDRFSGIDRWDDAAALDALVGGQERAVAAVRAAIPALSAAAQAIAPRLKAGGRLVYAGAGSSASIAAQDGSELPGTFGFSRERIVFLIAGGPAALLDIDGAAEDDIAAGEADVASLGDVSGDVVIAVSASGSTPYTLAVARRAKAGGSLVVGIANNGQAPLLATADWAVLLETGPEVVAGSTRMGAGTAQKCALGALSTLVAIRLGHVHDGMMVSVRADNAKLVVRARRIVSRIAGVAENEAEAALAAAAGDVKIAALACAGAGSAARARSLLAEADGHLRTALERLGKP
jgi:N-acetylmuramic acid 6-phosphate etherase